MVNKVKQQLTRYLPSPTWCTLNFCLHVQAFTCRCTSSCIRSASVTGPAGRKCGKMKSYPRLWLVLRDFIYFILLKGLSTQGGVLREKMREHEIKSASVIDPAKKGRENYIKSTSVIGATRKARKWVKSTLWLVLRENSAEIISNARLWLVLREKERNLYWNHFSDWFCQKKSGTYRIHVCSMVLQEKRAKFASTWKL